MGPHHDEIGPLLGGHAHDLAVGLAGRHPFLDRAPVTRFVGDGSAESFQGERLEVSAQRPPIGGRPLSSRSPGVQPAVEHVQEDDASLVLLGHREGEGDGVDRVVGEVGRADDAPEEMPLRAGRLAVANRQDRTRGTA